MKIIDGTLEVLDPSKTYIGVAVHEPLWIPIALAEVEPRYLNGSLVDFISLQDAIYAHIEELSKFTWEHTSTVEKTDTRLQARYDQGLYDHGRFPAFYRKPAYHHPYTPKDWRVTLLIKSPELNRANKYLGVTFTVPSAHSSELQYRVQEKAHELARAYAVFVEGAMIPT